MEGRQWLGVAGVCDVAHPRTLATLSTSCLPPRHPPLPPPLPISSLPVTTAITPAIPCQVCVRFADEDGQQEEEWEGRTWDEHAHAPNEYPNSTYKRLRVLWRATSPFSRGCNPTCPGCIPTYPGT